MEYLRRIALCFVVLIGLPTALLAALDKNVSDGQQKSLVAYVFWQEGCPHCAKARAELATLMNSRSLLEVRSIKLGHNAGADVLYAKTLSFFGYEQAAVPLVVIGGQSFLGFQAGGHSATLYQGAVEQCLDGICRDIVAELSTTASESDDSSQSKVNVPTTETSPGLLPDIIHVPLIGPVRPADLSLPVLTVLLAAIDGFNPCAMWVLVFLIGLLLGLEDERRMWVLGGAFLVATAAMYFAVMAVWLNLVLFLGVVIWVRVAIAILAIGGGFFFLLEYWTKPDAACRITNSNRRQKIMNAFRSVVNNNRLLLSVAGMIILAIMVNFIELLCSAGIPAVYTQVLALNDLSLTSYYTHIGLYIAVFMIDDIAIFATAMIALRVTGLTSKYARYSHLIGGVILLVIGAVMLLRPELLSFS